MNKQRSLISRLFLVLLLLPSAALATDTYHPEEELVIIPIVSVGDDSYEVLMRHQGNLIFQVILSQLVDSNRPISRDTFDSNTNILHMPRVNVAENTFEVDMVHLGNFVFQVTDINDITNLNANIHDDVINQLTISGPDTMFFGGVFAPNDKSAKILSGIAVLNWSDNTIITKYGNVTMSLGVLITNDVLGGVTLTIDVNNPTTGDSEEFSYGITCIAEGSLINECSPSVGVSFDEGNYTMTFNQSRFDTLLGFLTINGTLISGNN